MKSVLIFKNDQTQTAIDQRQKYSKPIENSLMKYRKLTMFNEILREL